MITTSRQSANRAIVPAIRQGLRHARAARAGLRRATRVDLDKLPTGAFCLVREHRTELSPSRVVNRLRQHSASETLHVQIFDRDQTVLVDQLARELVLEVPALIADVDMRPLQQPDGFTSPVTALLPPCHFPLSAAQP